MNFCSHSSQKTQTENIGERKTPIILSAKHYQKSWKTIQSDPKSETKLAPAELPLMSSSAEQIRTCMMGFKNMFFFVFVQLGV